MTNSPQAAEELAPEPGPPGAGTTGTPAEADVTAQAGETPGSGFYRTIEEIRSEHLDLSSRLRAGKVPGAFWDEAQAFVRRAQAAGVWMEPDGDREEVQAILGLWANHLFRSRRVE